jgi:mRNA-degrading endonuclease toxin of MazEF toxin-antitoxin module
MQAMPQPLTADDVLPLVACLTPQERVRLLRLMTSPPGADASVYASVPPARDEFSTDEEPLAWSAEAGSRRGEARRDPLIHLSSSRQAAAGSAPEVVLTPDDGMPAACALNFDRVSLAQRDRIGAVLCTLPEARWPEVERALLIACGFGSAEAG